MKHLRITVEGKTYEVTVEMLDTESEPAAPALPVSNAPVAAASIGATPVSGPPSPAQSTVTGPGLVLSPLAGIVAGITATIGQSVKEGDQLVVLEAMKMNTYVYAPQSGRVSEILIKAGDAVEEGRALVRLSP